MDTTSVRTTPTGPEPGSRQPPSGGFAVQARLGGAGVRRVRLDHRDEFRASSGRQATGRGTARPWPSCRDQVAVGRAWRCRSGDRRPRQGAREPVPRTARRAAPAPARPPWGRAGRGIGCSRWTARSEPAAPAGRARLPALCRRKKGRGVPSRRAGTGAISRAAAKPGQQPRTPEWSFKYRGAMVVVASAGASRICTVRQVAASAG